MSYNFLNFINPFSVEIPSSTKNLYIISMSTTKETATNYISCDVNATSPVNNSASIDIYLLLNCSYDSILFWICFKIVFIACVQYGILGSN